MKLIIFVFTCICLSNCVEINVVKPTSLEPPAQVNVTTTTPTPSITTSTTTVVSTTSKVENITKEINSNDTTSTTALPTTTTTTQVSSSTTTDATVGTSTETPVILNPFSGYINRRAENKVIDYHCSCDYQINVCEINCCCDLDCSKATVQMFDCSKETFNIQEYDHYGKLEDCSITGGLLCVAGSSVKKTDYSYFDASKKHEVTSHAWPNIFDTDSDVTKPDKTDRYDIGEYLLIFNETSEMIQKMRIPQTFQSSVCFVSEPITWLSDSHSKCRYSNESDELIDAWKHIKFLKYPVVSSMEYHCTNESCANITITHRYRNYLYSGVDRTRVEFIIWHNFTHVVDDIEMNVTHISHVENTSVDYFIEFHVIFKSYEEKLLEQFPEMSGMPGYIKQMPLLVSKKVTFTNYTQENKEYVLDFFVFNNRTEPYHANRTLKLPVSRKGRCILTPDFHQIINFGEMLYHKCHAPLTPDTLKNISSSTNFTKVCQTYQNQIFSLLLNTHNFNSNNFTSNIYVSQLGHPKNTTDDWIPLKFSNVPNLDQESVSGNWRQDSKDTFTCSNMIINVKYEFFYAQLRVAGVEYQNIIKEAQINFGPRLDLHFSVSDVSVPVFIQTQFYDLTRMSNRSSFVSVGVGLIFVCLLSVLM